MRKSQKTEEEVSVRGRMVTESHANKSKSSRTMASLRLRSGKWRPSNKPNGHGPMGNRLKKRGPDSTFKFDI
jgi:hypothetical protein